MDSVIIQRIIMNKVIDKETLQSYFVISGLKDQKYKFKTMFDAAKLVVALPYSYEFLAYDEDGVYLFTIYRMYEKYSYEVHFNEDAINEKRIAPTAISAFPFEALDKRRQKLGEDEFIRKAHEDVIEDQTQSIELNKEKISKRLAIKKEKQEYKWNKKIAKERIRSETMNFKVKKRKKDLKKVKKEHKHERELTQLINTVEKVVNKDQDIKTKHQKKTFIKDYILKKRNLIYVNNINLMLISLTLATLIASILVLILL